MDNYIVTFEYRVMVTAFAILAMFQYWVQVTEFEYSKEAFKALNGMTIKKNEMENKGLTNETAWKADERTYEE